MENNELKRSITWIHGTALTIGAVIGCGILVLPALTAKEAGPASLLSWVLMSIFAFPIVFTLARLAAHVPNTGGIIAYSRTAFGRRMGTLTGWLFLGSVPIGAPVVALTGAHYMSYLFALSHWQVTGIAFLLLALSLLLNVRGLEVSGKVSILIISMIIGLLLFAIAVSFPYVHAAAFHPFVPHGWMPIGVTSLLIFFSFVGWEMITPLTEEFKNPSRDIAISLFLAALFIAFLYISISIVTIGTNAYQEKGGFPLLSILISKQLGTIGGAFTAILALLISFGAVHTNISGFSRMMYAQAKEGDLPAIFSKLHPTYRTPIMAFIGLGGAFSVVLVISGIFQPNLDTLIKVPGTIFITTYIIAMAAAVKLLKRSDLGWWTAQISLFICIVIYAFSGWIFLFPILLGLVGWLFTRKKLTAQVTPIKKL